MTRTFYSGATPAQLQRAAMSGNSAAAAGYIETWPRNYLLDGLATSGRLHIGYFTSSFDVTVSQLGFITGGTARVGPTLSRLALFTAAADGSLTKVAQTANTSGLGSTTFATHQASLDTTGGFPASYRILAGQRYAIGWLFVGTTPPSIRIGDSPDPNQLPVVSRYITGQTDIAASYAVGTLTTYFQIPYLTARP